MGFSIQHLFQAFVSSRNLDLYHLDICCEENHLVLCFPFCSRPKVFRILSCFDHAKMALEITSLVFFIILELISEAAYFPILLSWVLPALELADPKHQGPYMAHLGHAPAYYQNEVEAQFA